jgi:predicted unusual protein kinase regulating ubiquinone biosynthesis (AarF/ABC1/UbiB family)
MVSKINANLRANFKNLLLAVSEKDADAIARIMIESDIVTVENDNVVFLKTFVLSFINYIETVNIENFQKNFVDKISSNDLPFLVNSNFLLILRGITILEGICKKLDPNFNYKKIIDPYIMEFPIDIEYYERRALKDIESLQKFSLPQALSTNQQNDIDKQLMEQKITKLQIEKENMQVKQNKFALLFMVSLVFSTIGVNNEAVQMGIIAFSAYSMVNKKK